MGFIELARTRRSVREYSDKDIPPEALEQCVEAARFAPSACNAQPWKFVIVTDPGKLEAIARAASPRYHQLNKFAFGAKAFIVIVSEKTTLPAAIGGAVKRTDFRQIDAGIACAHLTLQAWDMGIGSCILGWFDEKKIRSILGSPRSARIYLLVALGYPAKDPKKPKNLKKLSEVRNLDSYNS